MTPAPTGAHRIPKPVGNKDNTEIIAIGNQMERIKVAAQFEPRGMKTKIQVRDLLRAEFKAATSSFTLV